MYGLDRRIQDKLIQEAISSGLGRELREDGTPGDRVFEVNKDTVDIQLIEDTPRQKEEADYLRHRFIDDIIGAVIPGCEPINPLYVRATFYLAVGLCTGYLAYKNNQNLGHAPHPHPNPPMLIVNSEFNF